jgi:hypothetical protein
MTSSVNMYWLSASAQAAYADLAGADSKSEKGTDLFNYSKFMNLVQF